MKAYHRLMEWEYLRRMVGGGVDRFVSVIACGLFGRPTPLKREGEYAGSSVREPGIKPPRSPATVSATFVCLLSLSIFIPISKRESLRDQMIVREGWMRIAMSTPIKARSRRTTRNAGFLLHGKCRSLN